MLEIIYTSKFKKDFKRIQKRGKDTKKLKKLISDMLKGEPLSVKHRDHSLIGNYSQHRECHVESDWLLIYKLTENTLRLERTGTHSDLFS